MKSSQLNKSRFIVGIILIVAAVLMFLFVKGDYSTAGAIGIGVPGAGEYCDLAKKVDCTF